MQNGMTMAYNEQTGLLHTHKRLGVGYTVQKIKKYATILLSSRTITILIILLVVLVSFFIFALSEEEEFENVHLFGVSLSYPLTLDIHTNGKNFIQGLVSIQDTTESDEFPHPTWLYIQLQGSLNQTKWVTLFPPWSLMAEEEGGDIVSKDFNLLKAEKYPYYRWHISSNTNIPLAITMRSRDLYDFVEYEVVIAASILLGVYTLIVFELIDRTLSALLGSFVCVSAVSLLRGRPSLEEVIFWIDFETVGLLFGMMIMVGIFSETGFFEWSAIRVYKISKGNIWYLTLLLCTLTGFLAAFLDNVTTILLSTAITVRLCHVLDIPPEPIVLATVMFSNIGGTATVIGDPPNIIIASDRYISKYVNFFQFSLHTIPCVLLVGAASFVYLYFFMKPVTRQPHYPKLRELEIWQHTAEKLSECDEDERRVKEQLREYIHVLSSEVAEQPSSASAKIIDISELERQYQIRNIPLCINSAIVIGCVILLFFVHSWIEDYVQLSLAWISIIGCMIHLLLSGSHKIEHFLERIELDTLLFFAALFVMMKGIALLGLLDWLASILYKVIVLLPAGNIRLAGAVVLLLWGSGIIAGIIDNIPFTVAMVPIVVSLGKSDLGLPISVLVWALVFGTCFGGNATLIGASANVVACGILDKQGHHISFVSFMKLGLPIMIISLTISTAYLLITHVLIPWY